MFDYLDTIVTIVIALFSLGVIILIAKNWRNGK